MHYSVPTCFLLEFGFATYALDCYVLCGQFLNSQDRAVVVWNHKGCVVTLLKSGSQLEEILFS